MLTQKWNSRNEQQKAEKEHERLAKDEADRLQRAQEQEDFEQSKLHEVPQSPYLQTSRRAVQVAKLLLRTREWTPSQLEGRSADLAAEFLSCNVERRNCCVHLLTRYNQTDSE